MHFFSSNNSPVWFKGIVLGFFAYKTRFLQPTNNVCCNLNTANKHKINDLIYNTPMHTYLLSDLHLTPDRPKVIGAFLNFLRKEAKTAERIYILGDLFEFWIGDDAAEKLGAGPLLKAMKEVSETVDCYFMAGNRDFLVREQFTELTGFKILEDETVVDLYGTPTLLLHGDSLCTDDHAHQQFRKDIVTNRAFCDELLSLTIDERLAKAKEARQKSNEHKSTISMGIMDVTQSAVLDAFEKYNIKQMIHGHTHRQNIHKYDEQCTRYVLGDWHTTNSIMKADAKGLKIHNRKVWLQAVLFLIFRKK